MVTWPASVAPLAKTVLLPTMQSWAMWEYAMKRLLLADPRHAAALRGAAAHRGEFSKTVCISHDQSCALAH